MWPMMCSASRIPKRTELGTRPQIRLSLRKPKNWQVSLTTSASSSAIAIPSVRLHDETGRLVIDTALGKRKLAES